MQCPKCANQTLSPARVRGKDADLEQCPSCLGLWLDDGELGAVLGRETPKVAVPATAPRNAAARCPRCGDPLSWFAYPGTMTVVDACGKCGGIWLDNAELSAIAAVPRPAAEEVTCPQCTLRQPKGPECARCGIVFEKATSRREPDARRPAQPSRTRKAEDASEIPGLKGSLLRFIDNSLKSFFS